MCDSQNIYRDEKIVQETSISAKEPYIFTTEPYISAKEPCISSKEPVHRASYKNIY